MKKTFNRALAVILSVIMLFGALPLLRPQLTAEEFAAKILSGHSIL